MESIRPESQQGTNFQKRKKVEFMYTSCMCSCGLFMRLNTVAEFCSDCVAIDVWTSRMFTLCRASWWPNLVSVHSIHKLHLVVTPNWFMIPLTLASSSERQTVGYLTTAMKFEIWSKDCGETSISSGRSFAVVLGKLSEETSPKVEKTMNSIIFWWNCLFDKARWAFSFEKRSLYSQSCIKLSMSHLFNCPFIGSEWRTKVLWAAVWLTKHS